MLSLRIFGAAFRPAHLLLSRESRIMDDSGTITSSDGFKWWWAGCGRPSCADAV